MIPRRDDTPEVISARLSSYRTDTQPLLAHYASQHITFPVINTSTGKPEMVRTAMPVIHWDVHRGLWDSVGLVAALANAVGGQVSYSTGALKAAQEAKEEFAEVARRIRAAAAAATAGTAVDTAGAAAADDAASTAEAGSHKKADA